MLNQAIPSERFAVAAILTIALFHTVARAEGSWQTVGSTKDVRESAGLVVLQDGRVLVAGGHPQVRNPDGSRWRPISTAELYDPATRSWQPTGSLIEARGGIGTLTLLRNGKVLLAGEHDTRTGAELYDPVTGKWTRTGSLLVGRGVHSTTPLQDGRVLVAGGIDYEQSKTPIFASAELYDPASGKWTATGPMLGKRFKHSAIRLKDGKVLVAGGTDTEPSEDPPLASAELYDPATEAWKQTGALNQARETAAAVLLRDGRVLIAGGSVGKFGSYRSLASMEIYDPSTGKWSLGAPMSRDRTQFPLVLLPDGRALAAGGVTRPSGSALRDAEIFDPASGAWSNAEPLAAGRWNHRAALLPNGEVLVVGGCNRLTELSSAEVFKLK